MTIYPIKINRKHCCKIANYKVPISGFSHVKLSIPFSENEVVSKSKICNLDFEVLYEVSAKYAVFENKESLIEAIDKTVILILPMANLKDKNVVRVFLKLQNNANQNRVNESFTLYKV